jgi:hypothetical protein
VVLADKNLENIPEDSFRRVKYPEGDAWQYQLKTASFTRESSPLLFRTYLTFISADSSRKEMTRQHSFYVSEIRQTTVNPANFGYEAKGDQFFVSRQNKGAYAAGWVAATAVVAAAAAVSANNKSSQ